MLYIDYANRTNFYSGHFYGAWAFMAGFVVHVSVKFADMVRALRSRRLRTELRTGLAGTRPEPSDGSLVAPAPAPSHHLQEGESSHWSGGTSLAVFVLTAASRSGEPCAAWLCSGPITAPPALAPTTSRSTTRRLRSA